MRQTIELFRIRANRYFQSLGQKIDLIFDVFWVLGIFGDFQREKIQFFERISLKSTAAAGSCRNHPCWYGPPETARNRRTRVFRVIEPLDSAVVIDFRTKHACFFRVRYKHPKRDGKNNRKISQRGENKTAKVTIEKEEKTQFPRTYFRIGLFWIFLPTVLYRPFCPMVSLFWSVFLSHLYCFLLSSSVRFFRAARVWLVGLSNLLCFP